MNRWSCNKHFISGDLDDNNGCPACREETKALKYEKAIREVWKALLKEMETGGFRGFGIARRDDIFRPFDSIPEITDYDECPICDGKGVDPNSPTPCLVCSGLGKISSDS